MCTLQRMLSVRAATRDSMCLYLFSVTAQQNRDSFWWDQALTACQLRLKTQIKTAWGQWNFVMIINRRWPAWCNWTTSVLPGSKRWRNEGDSIKRAAYVHLNEAQLYQYRAALARRTLWQLFLLCRGTGGVLVFVISCVYGHRRSGKKQVFVFCVRECGCIYQVSEVHGRKVRNVQSRLSGSD